MALVGVEMMVIVCSLLKLHLCNRVWHIKEHRIIVFDLETGCLIPILVDDLVRTSQMVRGECLETSLGAFLCLPLLLLLNFENLLFLSSLLNHIYPFLREYLLSVRSLDNFEGAAFKPLRIALTQHVGILLQSFICVLANEKLDTLNNLLNFHVSSHIFDSIPLSIDVEPIQVDVC